MIGWLAKKGFYRSFRRWGRYRCRQFLTETSIKSGTKGWGYRDYLKVSSSRFWIFRRYFVLAILFCFLHPVPSLNLTYLVLGVTRWPSAIDEKREERHSAPPFLVLLDDWASNFPYIYSPNDPIVIMTDKLLELHCSRDQTEQTGSQTEKTGDEYFKIINQGRIWTNNPIVAMSQTLI